MNLNSSFHNFQGPGNRRQVPSPKAYQDEESTNLCSKELYRLSKNELETTLALLLSLTLSQENILFIISMLTKGEKRKRNHYLELGATADIRFIV